MVKWQQNLEAGREVRNGLCGFNVGDGLTSTIRDTNDLMIYKVKLSYQYNHVYGWYMYIIDYCIAGNSTGPISGY